MKKRSIAPPKLTTKGFYDRNKIPGTVYCSLPIRDRRDTVWCRRELDHSEECSELPDSINTKLKKNRDLAHKYMVINMAYPTGRNHIYINPDSVIGIIIAEIEAEHLKGLRIIADAYLDEIAQNAIS